MDAKHIKFTDSASLRCTRFEPYAFRSNITRMHQNFGRCITASCSLKNVCAKNCRKQLCWCFGCLVDPHRWSAKQIMWQATTSMAGLEKCGFFFLQKVLRFIAVDVTLWKFLVTPLKKGNRFPTPTLTPKILKNNYLCVLKLQRGVACDRWATTLDCALCTQSLTNSSLDI